MLGSPGSAPLVGKMHWREQILPVPGMRLGASQSHNSGFLLEKVLRVSWSSPRGVAERVY